MAEYRTHKILDLHTELDRPTPYLSPAEQRLYLEIIQQAILDLGNPSKNIREDAEDFCSNKSGMLEAITQLLPEFSLKRWLALWRAGSPLDFYRNFLERNAAYHDAKHKLFFRQNTEAIGRIPPTHEVPRQITYDPECIRRWEVREADNLQSSELPRVEPNGQHREKSYEFWELARAWDCLGGMLETMAMGFVAASLTGGLW